MNHLWTKYGYESQIIKSVFISTFVYLPCMPNKITLKLSMIYIAEVFNYDKN